MKLLSDRVKVELLPEEAEFTKSGLYLAPNPVTGKRLTYNRGRVVGVGTGRNIHGKILPMSVQVGDVVMYPSGAYQSYNDEEDNKKYFHIIYETDILAIMDAK